MNESSDTKSFLCFFHRETWPSHLNPAKIHVTGSHEKKISRVLPFRHQLNGVSIYIFSCSAQRLGRLSGFFPSPPHIFQTLDYNRTDNNPGSKPSLCLITQRKHQPTDYLVFALSTNTMQKETIGLPEQLFLLFLVFFLSFFLSLTALFFVTQKEIGRGCLMADGKGESN